MKIPDYRDVFFIPSSLTVASRVLAEEYDKADLKNTAAQ